MVTKQIDALGNVTTYKYDGNGNLSSKTDADGHTTEYTYDSLDLVRSINYNGEKSVLYRYNATGDLIYMKDWLGETTFEVDLMHRMKKATDHNGNTVSYAYDATGQQTAIVYPDGTTASYEYDLVSNQTAVTETDGSTTTYEYDTMGRVSTMHYPNGWTEYYTYDAVGRLISVDDTHPSEKPSKTQKHTYRYDPNGNLTYEYMRGNGTGQAKRETTYTYDELDRLVRAHDEYGNSTREYTYDSLGNLTYETGNGSHAADHRYNDLNQQISRSTDNWKTSTASEYDARGNLVLESYVKNKKQTVSGQYTYDASNKMTEGINANGEKSIYSYNGLGALMENTWVIAKNGYGYHDVNADDTVQTQTSNKDKPAGSNVKKMSTVKKQFVVDFTSDTYRPLQEHEVNGLDYRYVYSDKARLSAVVSGISNGSASLLDENGELHAYYHTDYLGTTDYLTSAVNSKVISWTNYNEWGEITHNAVLKCGQRELDLVKEYATHDYDAVLDQYYAKARFYDASNRRFTAQDPILDPSQYDISSYVKDPLQFDQYLYVKDNAVIYIDTNGETTVSIGASVAAAFGIGISGSAQIVIDSNNNIAFMGNISAGAGTPNASLSGAVSVTTAKNVKQLNGYGVGLAVGISVPIFGTEYSVSKGTNGNFIYGLSVAEGIGVIPVEIHANAFSATKVSRTIKMQWLYNKVYSAAKSIYNKLNCSVQKKVKRISGKFF